MEVARATAKSLTESLMNPLTWLHEYGIVEIANSILNSTELDERVAELMVAARNDGHAEGYKERTLRVAHALKTQWDTSHAATHGTDTVAIYTAAKENYDQLHIPVMDLIEAALQHDDFVDRLKEIFLETEKQQSAKVERKDN